MGSRGEECIHPGAGGKGLSVLRDPTARAAAVPESCEGPAGSPGLCAEKSLKGRVGTAEESHVFFPRTVPLEVAEPQLRGLRISLNTPVVSTEELAVGPARAGLLVHLDSDGRPNVTIGIRSLRSGEVVLYSLEGDLREHASLDVGVDAGLSFGESMGFLFDDDEMSDGDADAVRRCLGLWNELIGYSGTGSPAADAPPEALGGPEGLSADDLEVPDPPSAPADYVAQFEGDLGGEALDLAGGLDPDDIGVDLGISARSLAVAEGAPEPAQPGIPHDSGTRALEPTMALDLGVEADELRPDELRPDELRPAEPAEEPESTPAVSLSKFRSAPTEAGPSETPLRDAAADEVSERTELARVRLVRRGGGGSRRPHPIIRLLGAF